MIAVRKVDPKSKLKIQRVVAILWARLNPPIKSILSAGLFIAVLLCPLFTFGAPDVVWLLIEEQSDNNTWQLSSIIMVGSQSPKAPRMRHARKSIAHLPSQDVGGDKENATIDSTSFELMSRGTKNAAKKSRSKSLGPGGIDALKETTGNHGTVSLLHWPRPHSRSLIRL